MVVVLYSFGINSVFIFSRKGRNDNTVSILKKALASQKFDMAVITGDLVNGYAYFKEASIREAYHEVYFLLFISIRLLPLFLKQKLTLL